MAFFFASAPDASTSVETVATVHRTGAPSSALALPAVVVQFRHQRVATVGPDLSHRRTIVAQVLRTRTVREAVRDEMRDRELDRRAALLEARRYAYEMELRWRDPYFYDPYYARPYFRLRRR